jgi:hypothetical protein
VFRFSEVVFDLKRMRSYSLLGFFRDTDVKSSEWNPDEKRIEGPQKRKGNNKSEKACGISVSENIFNYSLYETLLYVLFHTFVQLKEKMNRSVSISVITNVIVIIVANATGVA